MYTYLDKSWQDISGSMCENYSVENVAISSSKRLEFIFNRPEGWMVVMKFPDKLVLSNNLI